MEYNGTDLMTHEQREAQGQINVINDLADTLSRIVGNECEQISAVNITLDACRSRARVTVRSTRSKWVSVR